MPSRPTRLASLAALVLAAAAPAQTPTTAPKPGMAADAAPCPAVPAPLPPDYAGWRTPTTLAAASGIAAAGKTSLAPGHAATVRLLPTSAIAYPVVPQHPGDAASHGGLVGFATSTPGTYRIALDAAAWIDVVAGGTALPSTAHGHGPACSGIRKIVDFTLAPGRYTLAIAGAAAPTIRVMLVPVR